MGVGVIDEQRLGELRGSVRGRILARGEPGYDEARRVWNGMIDKHPAVIAQCSDPGDVMTTVCFARENGLPASVRGGGHNVAGTALCDDGVVIDLSLMKQVQVDPGSRTARAGGGVTWGEFDRATQQFGLATTGGLISTTGIGGFTLGGGIGWLMREHGLTCDNLLAAQVVTADGKLVHASDQQNPDLFWALRGGGGNFGIVTEFTYRLHPVGPTVLGGMIIWPFSEADRMLRFYREYTQDLPDELTTMMTFATAPPAPFVPPQMQGQLGIVLIGCYAGPTEEGKRVLAPIREFSPPALDLFNEAPYVDVQSMLDPLAPAGIRNYWKSEYLGAVDDEVVNALVERFREVPSPITHVDVHHLGGAFGRVGEDETAFSHRDAGYIVNIISAWPDPSDDERNIAWTRDLWSAMRPYSLGASYVNFMPSEGEDRVRASYGEAKYRRLAELKRRYDPTNFFRQNQNIKPAEELEPSDQ